jgi:hypothetical protein
VAVVVVAANEVSKQQDSKLFHIELSGSQKNLEELGDYTVAQTGRVLSQHMRICIKTGMPEYSSRLQSIACL